MAGDGFFHLQRCVFGYGQVVGDQRGQCRTTRLPQQQRGLGIDVDKHNFDSSHLRLVALYYLADAFVQNLQPCRQVAQFHPFGACGTNGAAGHVVQLLAVALNDAKTGGLQAGVNTKNTHEKVSSQCS